LGIENQCGHVVVGLHFVVDEVNLCSFVTFLWDVGLLASLLLGVKEDQYKVPGTKNAVLLIKAFVFKPQPLCLINA
jgi:hypothetical protein